MSNSQEVAQTTVATKPQPKTDPKRRQPPPYHVVLLDDDEHTYDYVIQMLQSLFGYSEERAFQMAEEVDRAGRAIVCTTHKERAELKRDQILAFGGDVRVARCNGSMKAVIEPAE